MNQSEVITTLQYQAKIEPGFTSLGEQFPYSRLSGCRLYDVDSSSGLSLQLSDSLNQVFVAINCPLFTSEIFPRLIYIEFLANK